VYLAKKKMKNICKKIKFHKKRNMENFCLQKMLEGVIIKKLKATDKLLAGHKFAGVVQW
jgi:hypothetical protein